MKEFDREWEYRKNDKSKNSEYKNKLKFKQVNDSYYDSQPVFSKADNIDRRSFAIGTHIGTNSIIYLDFDRLLQTNVGVFGNSGTGKTFLTKLMLSDLIHQQAAVNLIFDLHSEYGREAALQDQQFSTVKGLSQMFPSAVEIYVTDPDSIFRSGVREVQELYLSYDQIEVEDIKLVSRELGISEDSLDNANILYTEFGKKWITQLFNMTNDEIQIFCDKKRGDRNSIMALQRKLLRLDNLKNMRDVLPHNYIHQLLRSLEAGKNVVVEFSPQLDMLCYMLMANMICRRIHIHYIKKTKKFLQTKAQSDTPRRLVITVEDAHHLLNSNTVHHNIFSTLLRQSWKFYITLFVVERYPSRIDKEIMSELGTRITGFLNAEEIDAMFTDVASNQSLRYMMSKVDSSQQALIFGYGVTAPVVVQTRVYDAKFYRE
ncbi:ATP-binding protein [Nostoc sp. DedSLP04]|nr:ATP-binding protein [Nostoc sp. DedSLP04]MDZ8032000.1 ATP-binding protein [Nostoc sp. DedSLP04]